MSQNVVVDPEQPRHEAPRYTRGMEVVHGVPQGEPLSCCGLGVGWTLFVLGFFFGIPWYIGAVYLCCVVRKKNYREKPGCFACLIAAVCLLILIILQVVLNVVQHRRVLQFSELGFRA